MRSRPTLCGSALIVAVSIACGQKGPPLPPLVLTPAPPVVTADRRGSTIDIGFTVPSANADGSRPANITRIDIFALNGVTATMSDLDLIRRGTRVASVPVKSPRNPSETVEAGQSTEVLEPPEGKGLDQGAVSNVVEQITADAAPLAGPADTASVRTYIGVGVDRRGRFGVFSKRVAVPLSAAPPRPSQPEVTYNETKITVRWSAPGSPPAELAYHVYDTTTGARLTTMPIKALEFGDSRIEWGATRCYAVRAVEEVGESSLESEASEPRCEKLADTFAPAPPKGLNAVSTDGAINLIWEANAEPDLAGYYVLRGRLPEARLERITQMPVVEATFLDTVERGVRYVYEVVAVDRAGNQSAPSNRAEETAR